jgi:hypothetical protein
MNLTFKFQVFAYQAVEISATCGSSTALAVAGLLFQAS